MEEDFERESSLGWLIAALSVQLTRALDAELRQHGLDIKLWPPLMCLWERDCVNQTSLGAMARNPAYTTTRVLDRLEALGLVRRHPDPNSRRNRIICLTAKGKALETKLTPLAQAVNADFLKPLSGKEQRQLVRSLQKVLAGRAGTTDSA